MAVPKVAFFEVNDWEAERLKKARPAGFQSLAFTQELNAETAHLAAAADIVSVFIYSRLFQDVLKKLPKLRMISTRSTGFDHIHLPTCRKRKIVVSNVPTYAGNTVAEHTFALILA